jgi:predicted dienelactone hydrolase
LLKSYPTDGIQVDLAEGLSTFSQSRKLIQATDEAVASIKAKATATPLPALAGQRLAARGAFRWQQVSLMLEDRTPLRLDYTGSDRQFPIDVYLPKGTTDPRPVIVISHGLNSDRQSYAYLAQHLASHGFVVAVPEHTGSNTDQLLDLLEGRANEIPSATEFLDRPLDVKFLLDDLAARSQSDPTFKDRLNLEQVGIIGQSFGGYTALALAGAPLNLKRLQQDCNKNLADTLNLSLVLQCQALRLPRQDYQLADPRIKAAIAINPIGSSLFGPVSLGQIQVPVMLVAGSADTIAPALPEQIRPFSWLTSPHKYFTLIQRGTHFSTIDESSKAEAEPLPTSPQLIGPAPELARTYVEALTTAFMQTYVAQQQSYQRYLSSGYVAALSRSPLPLSLVETLPEPVESEQEEQKKQEEPKEQQ